MKRPQAARDIPAVQLGAIVFFYRLHRIKRARRPRLPDPPLSSAPPPPLPLHHKPGWETEVEAPPRPLVPAVRLGMARNARVKISRGDSWWALRPWERWALQDELELAEIRRLLRTNGALVPAGSAGIPLGCTAGLFGGYAPRLAARGR